MNEKLIVGLGYLNF